MCKIHIYVILINTVTKNVTGYFKFNRRKVNIFFLRCFFKCVFKWLNHLDGVGFKPTVLICVKPPEPIKNIFFHKRKKGRKNMNHKV